MQLGKMQSMEIQHFNNTPLGEMQLSLIDNSSNSATTLNSNVPCFERIKLSLGSIIIPNSLCVLKFKLIS